jgi:hypothetical protein
VKIPPGISFSAAPSNEYFAVRVIGSSSSSLKKEERFIEVRTYCRAVTSGKGFEINLGLSFVIVKVKLEVTGNKESDTNSYIVYVPTSTNPTEFTSIWNSAGFVNIPSGSGNAAPVFLVHVAAIVSLSPSASLK